MTTSVIANASECIKILKQTGEIVLFVHTKSYLHNDLKGDNVFLDGANHNPILAESRKISNARFLKPKLHRGDRESIAGNVYFFGVLIHRVLKDRNFDVPDLKSPAKKYLTARPGKRAELKDILKEVRL